MNLRNKKRIKRTLLQVEVEVEDADELVALADGVEFRAEDAHVVDGAW